MFDKCPGAKSFLQPKPEMTRCPSCGEEVEIWTDETKTTCPACKATVMRQEIPSCLEWCQYAKECVGERAYNKYMRNKMVTAKQKLLGKMEECFGDDRKRIEHSKKVLGFAERLLEKEGGDWHIVVPASILHDIGIKEAERKYDSSAPCYQEKEGPPVAREMLLDAGFKREDTEEICQIIAHHHSPGKINTRNFKLVYDADWLVNLEEEGNLEEKIPLKELIERVFLTNSGKELARKLYV